MRALVIFSAATLIAAAAVAAPVVQQALTAENRGGPVSPSAAVFEAALVDVTNETLAANETLADLVELQRLLEQAIEGTFLTNNVEPQVAIDGVDGAIATLTSTGVMCDLPAGPATQRCEAVALAFAFARGAAEAAEGATGAIGSDAGAALGAPPSTGSGGGGGGGVTYPPVGA